ncbi:hypothetical protein V5O48_003877 [Marasmius crinis-equi]|uniref:Uncharacterized protein n=1 Tax=Marasmius crinis-equi TaxID=585013 RepID=A0ABR3FRM8_9AGAR
MAIPKGAPSAAVLNKLYDTVFNDIAAECGDEDVKSHIHSLFGVVIAVGRLKTLHRHLPGLTMITLHGLLQHLTDNADDALSLVPRLAAVIEGVHSPDAELFLLHKSLEDYLTDESRDGHGWSYINMKGHWIPKVVEYCIRTVHSNVFSDAPETSDILSFVYHYWTHAFWAHAVWAPFDGPEPTFHTESELTRMFLNIVQQGFLRWVYCARNYKYADPDSASKLMKVTRDGLSHVYDSVKQTPKIMLFLFWCQYREGFPILRKCYIPQFSNIASGSRDFFTILEAIEHVTQNSADLFSRLKPTDAVIQHSDEELYYYISGVPSQVVLESMIEGLYDTGRLDIGLYQRPCVSDNDG